MMIMMESHAGHHLAPNTAAWSHFSSLPRNFGIITCIKTMVGNSVASARETSEPQRYGPASSMWESMICNCFFKSAMAAERIVNLPKGGTALYRLPCIVAEEGQRQTTSQFDLICLIIDARIMGRHHTMKIFIRVPYAWGASIIDEWKNR